MRHQQTHFPVLQLYSLNVSSSAAVRTNSPRSSKLTPVICLGPCIGPREAPNEDEDGSGPGSTEPLKIFAGFSFVYSFPHQSQRNFWCNGYVRLTMSAFVSASVVGGSFVGIGVGDGVSVRS